MEFVIEKLGQDHEKNPLNLLNDFNVFFFLKKNLQRILSATF
jgi:hypothetical protein